MSNKKELKHKECERRQFIKQVVGASGLFAASLVSSRLAANSDSLHFLDTKDCEFTGLPSNFTYLNSGTEGSMPRCVIDKLSSEQHRWSSDPTTSYETDKVLGKHQHQGRAQVAKALSVNKDNICFTDNTTMAMNMVLMGLNFQATDKVILTNHEHNAIVSPLTVQQQRSGITLIERKFPTADKLSKMNAQELIEALFPNSKALRGAKALCVSHVYPTTGIRLPLNLLRKKVDELGIQYLIVDGAQAFGMIDLSRGADAITNADFYGCPGHKWLNGPPSTGILYIKNEKIRPPEFFPIMSQRMTKYVSGQKLKPSNFPMAEALQVRGCSNAPGFVAMQTAIDFQTKLGGFSLVEKNIIKKSNKVKSFIHSNSSLSLVSPLQDERVQSGLTVFFPFSWNQPNKIYSDKKIADKVVSQLLQKNIQIRSIGFDNTEQTNGGRSKKVYALRVSTAIFNTEKQLEYFFQSLQETLKNL